MLHAWVRPRPRKARNACIVLPRSPGRTAPRNQGSFDFDHCLKCVLIRLIEFGALHQAVNAGLVGGAPRFRVGSADSSSRVVKQSAGRETPLGGAMAHAAAAIIGRRNGMSHRHAAFRSRDPYGEDEGPNTCWVMFFGMVGLGLLLTGLEYGYSSFSDPRAKAIVPYNRAVDAWNNGLRQQMQESEFSYRAYSPRAVKIDVPEKTCEEGELHCNPVKAHNETRYEDVEPTDEAVASIPWIAFKPVVRNDSLSHDQIMSDLHVCARPSLPGLSLCVGPALRASSRNKQR